MWKARARFGAVLVGALLTTLVGGAGVAGAAGQATAQQIVDVPVAFQVQNTNHTPVPCLTPPDGKTYTIRGHLTGPADRIARGDAATLYLHAVTQGEFYWRFRAVPGYDFTRQQAERGHVSVTIDRLGYGASGKPPGLASCFGSQADTASQVITALKSGHYQVQGRGPARFGKVFVAGHSAGGLITTIMGYSFHNIDGLINFGWADQTTSLFTVTQLADTYLRCAGGGTTPGRPNYTPFGSDPSGILFHSATPQVRAAVPAPQPDPCGDLLSIGNGIAADLAGVSLTTAPVLIISGENDSLFPPPAFQLQALRYISDRDVHQQELKNTGHGFNYESTHLQSVAIVDHWLAAHGG